MQFIKAMAALGYTSGVDYDAQDDGDGPYIKAWHSDDPQPSPQEIAAAEASLPGTRAVTPVQFIRTLRDLGKYEAGLQVLGGVESADYAELVTSHFVSEADQRVVDGLAAIGVTLDEMFGPLA